MRNDDRNLNPHKPAVMAMCLFNRHYAAQSGGSMDFWASLRPSFDRSAATERLPIATPALCACKDRPLAECPGEWEPGCDLGNSPAHVRAHEPATPALLEAAKELQAVRELKFAMRTVRSDPYYITEADRIEAEYDRRKEPAWEAHRAAIAAAEQAEKGRG